MPWKILQFHKSASVNSDFNVMVCHIPAVICSSTMRSIPMVSVIFVEVISNVLTWARYMTFQVLILSGQSISFLIEHALYSVLKGSCIIKQTCQVSRIRRETHAFGLYLMLTRTALLFSRISILTRIHPQSSEF